MSNIFDQFGAETTTEGEGNTSSNVFDQFDETEAPVEETEEDRRYREIMDALFSNREERNPDAPSRRLSPAGRVRIEGAKGENIGTEMYEGATYDEAREQYKAVKSDPNVEGGVLAPVFTDPETGDREFVPRPEARTVQGAVRAAKGFLMPGEGQTRVEAAREGFASQGAKVGVSQTTMLGAAESVGASSELVDALFGDDPVEKRAGLDTETLGASLIADGIPALVSGAGAVTIAGKLLPAHKIIRGIGMFLAAETAASATVSTDEGTLVTGDNPAINFSPFGLLDGVDLGDDRADQVIEHRINVLTEGLVLSSALGGVAKVGGKGVDVYNRLLGRALAVGVLGLDAPLERQAFEQLRNVLGKVDPDAPAEERYAAGQRVAQIIDENKDVFLPIANGETDRITLDTISAFTRGAGQGDTGAIRAASLRRGLMNRGIGAEDMSLAVNRPQEALQEQTQAYLEGIGYVDAAAQRGAMEGASSRITGEITADLEKTYGIQREVAERYEEEATRLFEGYAANPMIGEEIGRLQTTLGTEIGSIAGDTRKGIEASVRQGYEDMTAVNQANFAQVRGGYVNAETVYSIFRELPDDPITNAAAQAASGPIARIHRIVKGVENTPVEEINPVTGESMVRARTEEETMEALQNLIDSEGWDFSFFFTQVRPELSLMANDLFNNPSSTGAGRKVRDTLETMDSMMMNDLAQNGDAETIAAAENAMGWFKDVYAPIWRSGGVMEDYSRLHRDTITRNDGMADGYKEGVTSLLNGILTAQNEASVASLTKAINATGSDGGMVADYLVLKALSDTASSLRLQDLRDFNPAGLSDTLQPVSNALRDVFPEKARQVDDYVTRLDGFAGNKREFARMVEDTSKRVDEQLAQVRNSRLATFLTDNGFGQFSPTDTPERAFTQIFRGNEPMKTIDEMVALANKLPDGDRQIVQDGLEVAYMRHMADRLLGATVETGGIRRPKAGAMSTELEGSGNLFDIGRKIFKDKPELIDSFEELSEVMKLVQDTKSARPMRDDSGTALNQQINKATNRLIYTVFGPLSHEGTITRAIVGSIVDLNRPADKLSVMIDNIYSNADEYLRLSEIYNADPGDAEAKKALLKLLFSAGGKVVSSTDSEEPIDDIPEWLR